MGMTGLMLAMAGGAAAGQLLAPKPQTPEMQAPPTPPATQTAKTPKQTLKAVKGAGQAGGSITPASTLLTGQAGVNPSALQLGKATLLGN